MIKTWDDIQTIARTDNYHCEHFTIDAYQFLTGDDISPYLLSGKSASPINIRNFTKIDAPKQHCIILMRHKNQAHLGIWHDNKVLHLTDAGVVHQPLSIASRTFKKVSFFEVKNGIV